MNAPTSLIVCGMALAALLGCAAMYFIGRIDERGAIRRRGHFRALGLIARKNSGGNERSVRL